MKFRISTPAISARRVTATLIVAGLIGGAGGLLMSRSQTPSWQSSRQALIRVWSIDSLVLSGQTADVTPTNLADAATVATSADVLSASATQLSEPGVTEQSLAQDVTAQPSQTSDFVEITARAPSAAQANRWSQAVADAFVQVVRKKVLASAGQIAALTAGTSDQAQSQIQVRAQSVAALDPVQIYRTGQASSTTSSSMKAISVGIVAGLALAALAIILLTFAAPRLRRPRDVTNALGLPAMAWSPGDDRAFSDRMGTDLLHAADRGAVAVCPARPEDAELAQKFATWLSGPTSEQEEQSTPDGKSNPGRRSPLAGVVSLGSPIDGLAASRPPADAIDTAVLVTSAGSPTETVQRAADLLGDWRRLDAVILVR